MITYAARWIFPATNPPLADARISIDAGRIVRIGGADPAFPVDHDLGDVAIVPGFVNAHTHLELGSIPWDAARGPEDEIAWLRRVIRSRFEAEPAAIAIRIEQNLRAAIEAGTTALGDITTAGQSWPAVAAAPVWATVFSEVLGLSPGRAEQTWQGALAWLDALGSAGPLPDRTRPGLSPHAPYSTAGSLYHAAAARGLPLATHLGELPEERPFLTERAGPLRQFVADLGAWHEAWHPLGPSPVDYVTGLGLDHASWIVAHGNIFEPAEYARLVVDHAQPAARRVAVAYCPRTHARFGHPPHPFRAMLAAGVVVCLGTDSLASSPSLSLLDEIRFLHHRHPEVAGATLLRMGTIHGAWALGIDAQTGSLEAGKSADLVVLPLAASAPGADPYAAWLADPHPPLGTMFQGRFVALSDPLAARVNLPR